MKALEEFVNLALPAFFSALCMLIIALNASDACAQTYPSKPIRIIVPFSAGGSVDAVARWVAVPLAHSLKHPVFVDNRAGAGGNIGAELVAKAAPDGHTLLITTPGLAIARSIYRTLPFDPATDFVAVSQLTSTYLILVTNPAVQATSVKALIALAKSRPRMLNYGSSGSGATIHLAMELFSAATGIEIVHVPYKGEAPAYTALLANEVQVALGPVSGLLPHIHAGRLRALGVSSSARSTVMPDIPTIAESGVPGFEFTSWFGLFAPVSTSREVISRLNAEVVRIMGMQEIRARLPAMGNEAIGSTPEQFGAKFKAEISMYANAVERAAISPAD